ncbi:MAG: hypothetical protein OWU84_01200 [Firmicutes bacterium]|nr:hypothetical protein [Bacillota bacterium]
MRSVAWLWGVTDNRLQRLADRVVPTADPTWWDPPGDLVLSLDEHSFGGQDWRVTVARRAPDRR